MRKILILLALLLSARSVIAQPVPPPGLKKVTHDSTFSGDGTVASPIGLATCVTSGRTWVWNGSAYACSTVGPGTVTSITTNAPLSGGPITGTGALSLLFGSGLTLSGSTLVADTSVVAALGNVTGTIGDLSVFTGTHTIGNYGGSNCSTAHNAVTSIGATGSVACSLFVDTAGTGLSLSSSTLNLSNTAVSPGSYTNASITVDAQGRITAASSGTVGTVTSISAGTGLSASPSSPITTSGTLNLANTSVTPGSYTYANVTVDAQGRLTSASNGAAPANPTVTSVAGQVPVWTNSSGGLGNSSMTDDGTTVTIAGEKYATCTSTTGGIANLTVPNGCSTLFWTPSSNANLVGIAPPASGSRHLTIVEHDPKNYTINTLNVNATAPSWEIEGDCAGATSGFLIDNRIELDYDPAAAKWETSCTQNVGTTIVNGVLQVTQGETLLGTLTLQQGATNFIDVSDSASSGNQTLAIDAAGTGSVDFNINSSGLINGGTGGIRIFPGANGSTPFTTFPGSGTSTIGGPLTTNGTAPSSSAVLSVTLATGTTNNWSPTGWSTTTEVIEVAVTGGGNAEISSLVAPSSGSQNLTICVTSGALGIENEGVPTGGGGPLGTAANRFLVQGGGNPIGMVGGTNHTECTDFYYSTNKTRWIQKNSPSTLNNLTLQNSIEANSSGSQIEGLQVVTTLAVNGNTTLNQASGQTTTIGSIANSNAQYTFLDEQLITTGSTWTPTTGDRMVEVTICGGGGGGGGASGGSNRAVGAGGGTGAILHFIIAGSSITSGTACTGSVGLIIGGAGTAGANTGGTGGTGGDTCISINGTAYTAKGGTGGGGDTNGTVASIAGGSPQSGSTIVSGSTFGGWSGANAVEWTAGAGLSGNGGGTPYGIAGLGAMNLNTAGGNATGFCSGGGGAYAGTSNTSGGTGSQGMVLIYEYR